MGISKWQRCYQTPWPRWKKKVFVPCLVLLDLAVGILLSSHPISEDVLSLLPTATSVAQISSNCARSCVPEVHRREKNLRY